MAPKAQQKDPKILMSEKKVSVTGVEDTSIEGFSGRCAWVCRLELDDQHKEQDMDTTSAVVAEGLVLTTRQSQPTQTGIC